jgi:hypothetical protein
MRFVQADVVTLKRVKAPTMYMLVVLEMVGDDLVKVCDLDGYNEQILPMKALKHPWLQ